MNDPEAKSPLLTSRGKGWGIWLSVSLKPFLPQIGMGRVLSISKVITNLIKKGKRISCRSNNFNTGDGSTF